MVDGRDRRAVQPVEHEHYFRRATVLDAHGKALPDGRRCECGVEITGSPWGINVQLVRAGQRFNEAVARGVTDLARAVEASRRRYREP